MQEISLKSDNIYNYSHFGILYQVLKKLGKKFLRGDLKQIEGAKRGGVGGCLIPLQSYFQITPLHRLPVVLIMDVNIIYFLQTGS